MLDRDTRAAILKLAAEGHGKKTIARLLKVSRNSVREVLATGQIEVPIDRPSRLLPHLDRIRELYASCKGNEIRVHEELVTEGLDVGYSTLTRFCRQHEIGGTSKRPAGRYDFAPGVEMQHDTSPHKVEVGSQVRTLQCASLVLCFSRKLYAQVYPRWSRFEARVFLSQAIQWLGGAAGRCMLDNSAVIIGHGTGKDAVPAPEMKAFADRFGFDFVAHELGDADRSGKVERPFSYIENNFYAGRTFADLADLNAQLHRWCERDYHRPRKRLGAKPVELFVAEQPVLQPLPAHIPVVYALHFRRVDIEGFVNLHTNRYSVDGKHIGHRLQVRETVDRVRVFDGHRLLEEHDKQPYGARKRETLPRHKGQAYRARTPRPPTEHEQLLRTQGPELVELIDRLRRHHGGHAVKAMRRLHRIWSEYPTEAVREAVSVALDYGLLDLERIERLVLQQIAGDFFRLPKDDPLEDEDDGR
jgi:transposase